MDLYRYYPWTNYLDGDLWAGGMGTVGMMNPMPGFSVDEALIEQRRSDEKKSAVNKNFDEHLRSSYKVSGYTIKASDGEIGTIKDFIVDDNTWKIELIEVDTGNWFPGKKVLIPPSWIGSIDWQMSEVTVLASKAAIKESPEYNPDEIIDEQYITDRGSYYNQTFH